MNYVPNAIDTSAVNLPDDLRELTERRAENAHNALAVDAVGRRLLNRSV